VNLVLTFLQVAILVDDMIDTGNTLTLAVKTLHEKGAKSIHCLVSHGKPFLLSSLCVFLNYFLLRTSIGDKYGSYRGITYESVGGASLHFLNLRSPQNSMKSVLR
jgi:hypothetical protein